MNKRTTKAAKRLIAVLLCLLCLLAAMPLAAIATDTEENQSEPTTVTEAATEAAPLPTETEPAGTEATEVTEAITEPTETTAPTETEAAVDPVQALYDRLMECTTLAEVNAILDNLTEEENALIDQFTAEQNAALSAKMAELGEYEVEVLDSDLNLKQGDSATYQLASPEWYYGGYTYKLLRDSQVISASSFGITITISDDNKLTIQTSDNTPAGTYEIQYGYIGAFSGDFHKLGVITMTVEAKQVNVPVTSTKQMTYNKTVTASDNGNYNLELTLSGAVGTKESKAKVDIVIVIDNSNSMYANGTNWQGNTIYDNNATRIKNARTAAKSLISTLADNEKIDAQYNIVEFEGGWNKGDEAYSVCTKSYGWTSNSTTASNNVDSISRNTASGRGGTNYEAGLTQAQQQINAAGEGATKVVVFLTDGIATFRSSNKIAGEREGYGNGTNDNGGYNLAAAKTKAGQMTMNRFYAIGVGEATEADMQALANAATNATVKKGMKASDSDLTKIFNDIAGEIATFLCSNVTITDTLAHEDEKLMVQVTDPESVKVKVLDKDGKVIREGKTVTLEKTTTNEAATLTASYDADTGELKLNFPTTYKLEPDYTYVLCAEIAPTEKAYQEYRETGYTDVGDAGTGDHAGQVGFHSNDEAKVTYTYEGTNGSVTYDKPVVQLNPGKLIVTKTFDGLTADQIAALGDTLKFKIKLIYPTPTGAQDVEVPLSAFTTNTDGTYTYTITGLSPNTTYTVEETGADVEGMSLTKTVTGTESGTVAKGQTVTVGYKNAYTQATTAIIIEKRFTGNMGSHGDPFNFTVTGNSVADADSRFSLKHGETKTITVKVGDTITVAEAQGNYTASYVVKVGEKQTATGTSNSVSYTVTGDEGQKIIFTNDYEKIIDTGILLDTLPYILILAVVAVGAVVMIRKRRNRDED